MGREIGVGLERDEMNWERGWDRERGVNIEISSKGRGIIVLVSRWDDHD